MKALRCDFGFQKPFFLFNLSHTIPTKIEWNIKIEPTELKPTDLSSKNLPKFIGSDKNDFATLNVHKRYKCSQYKNVLLIQRLKNILITIFCPFCEKVLYRGKSIVPGCSTLACCKVFRKTVLTQR